MADVHDVAAAVIARTGPESPMKLQKLLYYAQAWNLAEHGEPLFDAEIEAWRKGPVVRSVWERHRYQNQVEVWDEGDATALTPSESQLVASVVARYGGFSRDDLSAMTHDEEPWQHARAGLSDSEPSCVPLSRAVMASYFRRQVTDPHTAAAEALASARIEGLDVSPDAVAVAQRVSDGELSMDQAVAQRIEALLGP